jgi:hypothetical protein
MTYTVVLRRIKVRESHTYCFKTEERTHQIYKGVNETVCKFRNTIGIFSVH